MRFVPDVPAAPLEWQVCFVGMQRGAPWDWLLAPGYRHVFAMGYVADFRFWLVYDVSAHKTEIVTVSPQRAAELLGWAHREGGVLTFPAPGLVKLAVRVRAGAFCVRAIKNLLCVDGWAVTPKGLWRELLRRGARPLISDDGSAVDAPAQARPVPAVPQSEPCADREVAPLSEPVPTAGRNWMH